MPTVMPTVMPTATVIPLPTATPAPTATPVPSAPTPTLEPTTIPESTATLVPSSGTFNLSLDFEGIDEEGVVYGETVLLRGQTSADAIVSVNDVIVEVQPDGTFELTIVLTIGPNWVDVMASNLGGSSVSQSQPIFSILLDETG